MISFSLSLIALVLGYLFYGRFVERVFAPDNRPTPALAKADGMDYVVLPSWKIFMIQFLNRFSNQALSVFTLWTVTVYLVRQKKAYWITLIPALFMTTVCSTFFFVSKQTLHLSGNVGYILGGVCLVVAIVWFCIWYRREVKSEE